MELVLKIIVLFVISYGSAVINVNVALKGDIGELPHHHHQRTLKPVHGLSSPRNLSNKAEDSDDRTIQLRKNLVDCTEETKVNPNVILALRTGKWRRLRKEEPEGLKKWALCLLVKSDMMSENGVLKQDTVLAHIPMKDRDKAEKAIDECLYKKARPAPEVAWHYIRCFRNKFSKYSII